jgi:hypothetical protein
MEERNVTLASLLLRIAEGAKKLKDGEAKGRNGGSLGVTLVNTGGGRCVMRIVALADFCV